MTGYGTHGASSRFDQKDSRMGDRGSDRKGRKRMRIAAAAVLSAFLSLSGAGIPMTGTGFVTFAVAAQTASTAKAKTASSASARVMDHALVVSFVHRDNIGSTSKMDVDALSTATVYSGPTGEKKSTIEVIRDTLKKETKAKTFAIRVKKAYSKNYSKTVDRADREIDRDTKLALKKKKVAKWKTYKTIFLCTPVWHGTLPQPVKMFLKANDFSGKTIYLFGAHLGSGFGDQIAQIRALCPGAKVRKGKTYLGDATNKSVSKSVKKWVRARR